MKLFRDITAVADVNYNVGDVIAFTLNDGEEVEAMAVKQEQDGMIFYLVDCLSKEYSMNPTGSNCGGYKSCALRKTLNTEILDRFPDEIRKKMITFDNGDFLRLATEREIFGENIYGEQEDDSVQQWEPMKDRRNRISFQGNKTGTWQWYWLQNKAYCTAAYFAIACGNGDCYYGNASYAGGVHPVFKITI